MSLTQSTTNARLGYPDDARLLIINADDFGMCHAINKAILRALKEGVVASTSVMAPCPWALHAMHVLRENPDIPFGVHLTAICEMVNYKWKPLTSKEFVPSLIDESGYFYGEKRIPEFLAQLNLAELEMEFRVQIETVLQANLQPTHLDWHCLHNGGRPDIFHMTFALAQEYGLALRVAGEPFAGQMQSHGLPTNDHDLLDSFRLDPAQKPACYAQLLRDLPVGLSEWAVHPGFDDDELLTLEPDGNHVRQTDFDFLISAQARDLIAQEGITVISYQPLQAVWQNKS